MPCVYACMWVEAIEEGACVALSKWSCVIDKGVYLVLSGQKNLCRESCRRMPWLIGVYIHMREGFIGEENVGSKKN